MSDISQGIAVARFVGLYAGVRVCLRHGLRFRWSEPFDAQRCACAAES